MATMMLALPIIIHICPLLLLQVAPNPVDQDKWVKAFHDAMRNVRMRSLSSPVQQMDTPDQSHHRTRNPTTPPEM